MKTTIYLLLISSVLLAGCKKKTMIPTEVSASELHYIQGGINDNVNAVEKTRDGGFIYCGYTSNGSNQTDAFLLKTDKNGKLQWYKKFGGARFDAFKHAIETDDGNFIAVGFGNSIGKAASDSSHLYYSYVVKTDANGNELWSKSYFNSPGGLASVTENANHEFIITGNLNVGQAYPSILMLDADGKNLGGGYYGGLSNIPPYLLVKNYFNTYGRTIICNRDGSYMIGGLTAKSGLNIDAGRMTTILMHVFDDGSTDLLYPYYNWVREGSYEWGFPYPNYRRATVKLIQLSDGYMIGTWLEFIGGVMTTQLIKTNNSGVVEWEKQYSGLGNSLLTYLVQNPDGTFLITGASSPAPINTAFPELFKNLRAMILKVDKDGNQIWASYPGGESNANVAMASKMQTDGGWKIAGYTCISENGNHLPFTLEIDKNGAIKKQ